MRFSASAGFVAEQRTHADCTAPRPETRLATAVATGSVRPDQRVRTSQSPVQTRRANVQHVDIATGGLAADTYSIYPAFSVIHVRTITTF